MIKTNLIEWRKIPFAPLYLASCQGHVFSLRAGRTIALTSTSRGNRYLKVGLILEDGTRLQKKIHRVICETFHGAQPSPKHEADHIEPDTKNNRARNLTWLSREAHLKKTLVDRKKLPLPPPNPLGTFTEEEWREHFIL